MMLPTPDVPIRAGIVPALILCLIAGATCANAQGSNADRLAIVEQVVLYFADHYELTMDQIVLDTVRTGRAISRASVEQRARLISVQELRGAAERRGFRLAGPNGIGACFTLPGVFDVPCLIGERGVGLTINAPDVTTGAASVRVMYMLADPGHPDGSEAAVMRFELIRAARGWEISEAVVERKASPSRRTGDRG